MSAADLTMVDVCRRSRLGRRTLDRWLALDALQAPPDRRLHHHTRRGRQRIWTEKNYQTLVEARLADRLPTSTLAASIAALACATVSA